MALYSNFAHFYPKNVHFSAKKWLSVRDGVLIKSGVLLAWIRYLSFFISFANLICQHADKFHFTIPKQPFKTESLFSLVI